MFLALWLAGGCQSQTVGDDVTGFWRQSGAGGGPTLNIAADGSVSGRAPCNRFATMLTNDPDGLAFAPIAATRMACPELAQEQAFFDKLASTTGLQRRDSTLILMGPDGETLRFVSVPQRG